MKHQECNTDSNMNWVVTYQANKFYKKLNQYSSKIYAMQGATDGNTRFAILKRIAEALGTVSLQCASDNESWILSIRKVIGIFKTRNFVLTS